ncbi:hypothetical protein, partial [Sulfuricurvum sp.]|uniref:hypothetical protein n=1 Tax=Sulfuricurvum sp. TaxID=2025608 RepID=UPI001996AFA6
DNNGTWINGTGTSFNATEGTHTYAVRQIDTAGNISEASAAKTYVLDATAPTATLNINSSDVSAQSSEAGTGYLVNSTVTINDVLSITNSADNLWNSVDITSANTPTTISTTGLAVGTYYLYTVDAAGNISAQSSASYSVIG